MIGFKNTTTYIVFSLLFCNQASTMTVDNIDDNIIHTADIYKYSDNQDEDTETFFPKEGMTQKELEKELSKLGAVHINLIDCEVGDSALVQLIPYAHLIHGLSLSDNYFTNEALNHLTSFSELKYLELANNSFLNPSLASLRNLKHLSYLDLRHNKIDSSEIKALQEQMPKSKIVF